MAKLLRKGEVLRVRTILCSTMCTQNCMNKKRKEERRKKFIVLISFSLFLYSVSIVIAEVGLVYWRSGRANEQIHVRKPGMR